MRVVPLFALLILAAPAVAQQAPAENKQEEKKVCRTVEATGSILGGKRECHTKAEWAKIHQVQEENAARALDQRRQIGPGRN